MEIIIVILALVVFLGDCIQVGLVAREIIRDFKKKGGIQK